MRSGKVSPRGVVCLGEALVDLICERPVGSLGEADSFVPRLGGSVTNIAVAAARFGAKVELLGGAGDDDWGRWLVERVAAEGIGLQRFALIPGLGTSHAFVVVNAEGDPGFIFYGDSERPVTHAAADLEAALSGDSGVLVVGSDTLLGQAGREVTMRAATLARERGWCVLCDPNLRPGRWSDRDTMLATIRLLIARTDIVKCNEPEALALAGEETVEQAGAALRELGPEAVVVTRAGLGASVFSATGTESVAAREAVVVDATGAGDSVAGVLAAALAAGAEPDGLARPTQVAMEIAAGVVGTWGATEGLPGAPEARARLAAALGSG